MTQPSELRKLLILALGGEGGGTLTQWVVDAALACGWPVQSTSIPGVAQRSGATSYYIECLPRSLADGEVAPPMCLAPMAGDLDLVISSELLETARAVERGLPSAARTHLISSTTRSLTVHERSQGADGRWDTARIEAAARQASRQLTLFDMSALARREGTVVSAVMFGAVAASGVLPLPREVCERVLGGADGESASSRTQASRRGFAAGWSAVAAPTIAPTVPDKRSLSLDTLLAHGEARLVDHQDAAYAQQYRSLIDGFAKLDGPTRPATTIAARSLALWMAYEDVIRVADLKSRRSRFEQIRSDHRAGTNEPVVVRDFLKPGVDEIAAILPPALAARLRAWGQRRGRSTFGEGVQLATSSVSGLLLMRLLANARFLRRGSDRFQQQQALVARWSAALSTALQVDGSPDKPLACAVADLPRLIKGYGSTFERGHGHFLRILENRIEPGLKDARDPVGLAAQIRQAMQAALANPEGSGVFEALGLARPAVREQPIQFVKPEIRRRPS